MYQWRIQQFFQGGEGQTIFFFNKNWKKLRLVEKTS